MKSKLTCELLYPQILICESQQALLVAGQKIYDGLDDVLHMALADCHIDRDDLPLLERLNSNKRRVNLKAVLTVEVEVTESLDKIEQADRTLRQAGAGPHEIALGRKGVKNAKTLSKSRV